jgi:ankyrin repeat protein
MFIELLCGYHYPVNIVWQNSVLMASDFQFFHDLPILPSMKIMHKNIRWMLLFCLLLPVYSQARDINLDLINAARAGRSAEVRALIAAGADINATNPAGKTVLMMAANFGNARIVDMLLAEGANVNTKDKQESTALIDAAYMGNLQVIKALLARGADVNATDKNGVTALSMAKTMGNAAVIETLEAAADTGKGSEKPKSRSKSKKK